jgi:hypothetical protein
MKPNGSVVPLGVYWLLVSVMLGCTPGTEPDIAIGMDGCAACGMAIPEANQACAFRVDRDMHVFCSSGCLIKEYEARRRKDMPPPDALFFADYETGEWVGEGEVVFVLSKRVPTVMKWGILNFGDRQRASTFKEPGEALVDWPGLRTLRGEVDRSVDVILTPSGLMPEILKLDKGQLVEWSIRSQDLSADATVILRGYEELGEIVVPASGEPVTFRMLASRPGAGFPMILVGTDVIVGQVRIRGAHTADEAAL